MQIKILALGGSSDIAVLGALDAGAQVSNIRLRDLPLPIYDGDWETLGGMRAQIALQISLNKLGLLVIPNSFALGLAHQAFDEKWLLKDANTDQGVRGLGAALVTTTSTLAPQSHHSECGTNPDEAAPLGSSRRSVRRMADIASV